jgi:hypothetical protein
MCQVTLLLLLVVPAVAEPTTDAEVNRLVRQLGSESYAQREAGPNNRSLMGTSFQMRYVSIFHKEAHGLEF